ncbi:small RNA 2'-O-methyltransferase [Cololabis saira]|uniref:small RNA 2'-O-methyltransferase n=1 Tax=Cololabis saira TaxID=129043 RepID=UPI002AD29D36|nr:small RNA 2'-O-methyltransferase [Cololabis saira]
MEPLFSPALHSQRHQFVIDFVMKSKPRKVADLGCGECSLLRKLRFHREIQVLVGVDINGAKIQKKKHKLAPISTEYLQPSFDQLRIEMYQGSVTRRDARLKGFDLVTCIELIEHLTLANVEHFSAVVFGYMTPVTVIVSTPNSEFNPLLPGLSGFRHSDHKFEWTRAEFRSWALKVCLEYGYEVEFTGVGENMQSQQDRVGFCSQIGVFHRIGGRDHYNTLPGDDAEDIFSYTLLYTINYPSLHDNNTLRKVLVGEVIYWAEQIKNRWMEEKTGERSCAFSLCEAVRGLQELHMEPHEELKATACADEMEGPVNQCKGGVYDEKEDKWDEMPWPKSPEQQDSCAVNRCVFVPLSALWSCCPKVSELSGSVNNLQHLLMDEPDVKLSQDGCAVLVKVQEQDREAEVYGDLDDSGYTEASQCSHSVEQEENWETNY